MDLSKVLNEFLDVSIALSKERDTKILLETILSSAKRLANADAGTIYSINERQELIFDTLFNDSLNLHVGGSSKSENSFSPIPIYIDGEVNMEAMVAHAAASDQIINIDDIYRNDMYNFARAKQMDDENQYRTQSVLTIPMKNHEGELNGVLQLVNAQNNMGEVIPFSADMTYKIQALTSLASVALTNRQLIDAMEELFQAFTQLIAKAIDEKSPYTGGHCRRVPILTMMIAEAVHRHKSGPMAEFYLSDEDRHELNLAGWIHDCGKVAIPEYIMDKSKKLETVWDRIDIIKGRFELAKRDLELGFYRNPHASETDEHALQSGLQKLDDDFAFVESANTGGEFMTEADQQRLSEIGRSASVYMAGEKTPLLTEDEIYNLQTARGTLNAEERTIINRHMDITVEMLESLPFPKHLRRVPEFAGGHHEKMDGTGYPKQLTREQMSVPARIMAIADIFEALTASDRPYKDAKKISECLFIMGKMKLGDHIDPDLFDIFVKEKVYEEYAHQFLKPEQLDAIDTGKIPGFDDN